MNFECFLNKIFGSKEYGDSQYKKNAQILELNGPSTNLRRFGRSSSMKNVSALPGRPALPVLPAVTMAFLETLFFNISLSQANHMLVYIINFK